MQLGMDNFMIEKQKSYNSPIIKESREGGRINESKRDLPEFVITAEDIHHNYFEEKKTLSVLKGVHLQIRNSEIVALIGPSGAGKSTLLHILGLMDKPTSGKLNVLGWETPDMSESEKDHLRNKYIGFLFQFHYLLPELTILENAALPQRILGINNGEANERASELLNSVGLKERLNHYPSEISGGEQQRAALARAMINRPAILICDEPTGNLDLDRGSEIRDLIWRVARAQSSTVIVATHNPDIAKSADRIIKIANGKIEVPE